MTGACGRRLRDASRVRHLLPVPPRPAVSGRAAAQGVPRVGRGPVGPPDAEPVARPGVAASLPGRVRPRGLPVTHELRALAAARLVVPGSVVTGRSAAGFWGVELAGAADDVELTVPPGRHPVRTAGVRVRRSLLDPAHVTRRGATPVTTAEATAVRLAGTCPATRAWSRSTASWQPASSTCRTSASLRQRRPDPAPRGPEPPAHSPTGSPSHPRRPGCAC